MSLGLHLIGTSENAYFINCENPSLEVWKELLLFRETGYFTRATNQELVKKVGGYVSTSLDQAYGFFKASQNVELNIRPLLLYYSFLTLSKAVLSIKRGTEPSDYHGLCRSKVGSQLIDFNIKVSNGIFHELGKELGYNIPIKTRLSLGDFCSQAVSLSKDYQRFFDSDVCTFPVRVIRRTNAEVKILFNKRYISIQKLSLIPGFTEDFFVQECEDGSIEARLKVTEGLRGSETVETKLDPVLNKYVLFNVVNDNAYWFNSRLGQPDWLPQAICYFGAMFVLGSIVRYNPILLSKSLESSGGARWFLSSVCELASRSFPNLMLNFLYNKPFKFVVGFI